VALQQFGVFFSTKTKPNKISSLIFKQGELSAFGHPGQERRQDFNRLVGQSA
jgi:hypothetical protein